MTSPAADQLEETFAPYLAQKRQELPADSALHEAYDRLEGFLQGGKRLRTALCFIGAECGQANRTQVADIAAAVELFHAAALAHDDLIDKSDSRRGQPALHRQFCDHHQRSRWDKSAQDFGAASAILLGDLLFAWSNDFFCRALLSLEPPQQLRTNRIWQQMQAEVALGQYMDVLNENNWRQLELPEAIRVAEEIMSRKSGKYSVEYPLCLGASFGGASDQQLAALAEFAMPVGLAFQMRDDLIGAFGDTAVTGKPSGDDLAEGKHTLLIGLARRQLPPEKRQQLENLLGRPGHTETMRGLISESGAVDQAETLIQNWVDQAMNLLKNADFAPAITEKLAKLTRDMTSRNS